MPVFKDTSDREWQVTLDAPKIRDVRTRLQLDLVAADGGAFDKLAADPVLLVDVLWVLVGDQRSDVTDVQFGRSLGGDSLEAAANALTQAALDFFRPGQRSLLRCLDEKQTALRTKAKDLAIAKISDPKLEEAFLARVAAELDKGLSKLLNTNSTGSPTATSSPASVESTPPD